MAQRKVNCEVYTDRGIVGKSAYQQAVKGGYQGTEEEFEQALASDISVVADNVTNINAVGNNIENVNTAVDNMSAIIAAPTSATQAATSASQAATSATNAQTSETNSATSASNAAESATNASASATIATTKASEATSSATSASASANSASASATSASTSATNAQTWAEGTDAQVTTLGGEHSSKGWANIAKQYAESIGAATADTLGLVKPDGTTITVTEDGTISATDGSGSGFDFEGTKAEFDAAVAAGTITEDSISLITDDVSGDNVATKAELQNRVSKAGDTMTGPLIFPNSTFVQFGVGSGTNGHYYIKQGSFGELALYYIDENNVNKGLFLADETRKPYYYDGTNGYRLLTTNDIAPIQNNLFPNFNAGVSITSGTVLSFNALVIAKGSPGGFNTIVLYADGKEVWAGGVSENTGRFRAGGAYCGKGTTIKATNANTITAYPMRES